MKYLDNTRPILIKVSLGLLLTVWLVAAPPLSGQTPSPAQSEEMRKLEFLLGEWKGKGWMYRADGSRIEISQNVKVERESGGPSLRVKDTKKYKAMGLDGSSPSHAETATIYFDEGTRGYRWRRGAERKTPFEAKLIEAGTLQWEKHSPGSVARTTIRVKEDGEWHETLEFWLSKDGWFRA
jgi:hypothetical protein